MLTIWVRLQHAEYLGLQYLVFVFHLKDPKLIDFNLIYEFRYLNI